MPLQLGDQAPTWTLLGVVHDTVAEVSLESALTGVTALVLTTYPLDFSDG